MERACQRPALRVHTVWSWQAPLDILNSASQAGFGRPLRRVPKGIQAILSQHGLMVT